MSATDGQGVLPGRGRGRATTRHGIEGVLLLPGRVTG